MSKNASGTSWVLPLFFLGLTAGLAGTALTHAGEGKNKPKDPDAKTEAEDAAKEDRDEVEGRRQGKPQSQRRFHGTFLLPSDPSQQTSPDVVGTFVTDEGDMKPNQTYLVKIDKGSEGVLEALKRNDTKKVTLDGKLRNQAKYLIVRGVSEPAPGAPVTDRRGAGGL